MIRFQFFPRSQGITTPIQQVIDCFNAVEDEITSKTRNLSSDKVLAKLRIGLEAIGFRVEAGKTRIQKISVPVLFGLDNQIDKSFNADAVSADGKIVIEVEAGRAIDNNQFLKDIFQACMMFEVEYLVIAVRNDYRGKDDFKQIHTFLETRRESYLLGTERLTLTGGKRGTQSLSLPVLTCSNLQVNLILNPSSPNYCFQLGNRHQSM